MDSNMSLSDIAAVTRDNDFGGNNSSWVLIILFAMIFGWGGNGFGNNSNAATNADIQRAVDLNSIQEGQANIGSEIQRGIYEINANTQHAAYDNLGEIRDVQAAVATGNANIINNMTAMQALMQTCCCETKQQIMENRYLAAQTSSENTQKILDAISANRMADMQNQISQLQLQNAVAGVVRYPQASTYYAGANPFCSNGSCGNI